MQNYYYFVVFIKHIHIFINAVGFPESMIVLTKAEFELKPEEFLKVVQEGKVFIHPTDTIYGIGCDATNSEAVNKIRNIKVRYTRPYSVIAPSKYWIKENCIIPEGGEEWLDKLPGPYTLILKLKNKNAICSEVNNGADTIGVRIPDHWFAQVPRIAKLPVVTTSANFTGQDYMTDMDNLDPKIKSRMDYIIYEGEKNGRPSTIIHLDQEDIEIKER